MDNKDISWLASYSVGHPELDMQHKQILALVSQLNQFDSLSTNSEKISEILQELTNYANAHFDTEESILKHHGYTDLKSQELEHAQYREKITEFCLETMVNKNSVPRELALFLEKWWKSHILYSDMKFKCLFQNKK